MNPLPNPARRHILLALASLPLTGVARAAGPKPGEIGMLEAINQAGRQRMLSQRMAKLYAQQVRGVRASDAQALMSSSISLFDSQLDTLRRLATSRNAGDIVQTYDKLSAGWRDYRQVVSAPANPDGLLAIASLNEQVLATAHQGTLQLERLNGSSLGKLVNLAGRQRMLSQRMSKFYFFIANGMDNAEVRKGLEASRSEFIAAMQTLKRAPESADRVQSWITLAESQWVFFDEAIRSGRSKRSELDYLDNNVAVSSENILQVMDKLTELYATSS
ncbi:MAG: type IV pili methyl-accepting chemotaxis transducer N-terminal domain-containing protein [Uliginosibacterium sp.]|jgi:hypothetical protein|nr:type IV pili methyl-accepting chemotaxis transducer N-terminal domain-containing protein [Uliginosibacterium sp.]MBK9617502.1 type IV pili methyl-accepting chemotaxis transducer N-terminal domain-containing protein [Uliginosibacterium sp.]